MILFRTAFMISMYLCRIYFDGSIFFLMIRRPPRSTRTDTLFPSRRSSDLVLAAKAAGIVALDQAVVEIRDDDQFRRDAEKGRDLGYERSEEHTSELQSLMRISYAVFCLKKKKHQNTNSYV